jgi:curli biogenesis system outer membrane secretion channel CsgG
MDRLFQQYNVTNWLLTSDGIPDATGEISAGTKEMLISAISQTSVKSNAFNFVDFDAASNITTLASFVADPNSGLPVPNSFEIPNYYLRGAITQLDSGVIAETASAAVGIPEADIGVSTDQVASVVSVDVNIGNVFTRQMIPGVSASNSIVVRRSGKSADAGATIDKLGLNFNLSFNRSEGMHAAVRTLVELSTIEVLGKLTQVPYWRCLEIDQTNPEVERQARDWFAQMESKERVIFVQRALKGMGRYDGPIEGDLDDATREAIGLYQSENQQIANGEINFDLYASLIASDLALGRAPKPDATPVAFEPRQAPKAAPVSVNVTTPRGPHHRFVTGELLQVSVEPSADAFTYCYYQDGDGQIARLFPNRFMPDALLLRGQVLQLPGPAPFDLVLSTGGVQEQVMCLASINELGPTLPAVFQSEDLAPLPVQSLDDVKRAYSATAGKFGSSQMAAGEVTVHVLGN